MHDLQQTLHLFGRSGAVMYALSGVDIALWDIAGKVAGKPLYKLLGGDGRARFPPMRACCAAPGRTPSRKLPRALEQGYRQIKLHEITVPAVQAARDAVGPDVALMLDTNCPWSVRRGARDGRGAASVRSALAGGAGLAAGGSRGAREGARRGRR